MTNLVKLKKDKDFNNKLVKFLGIIFHPEKYPLSEQIVIEFADKLFSDFSVKDAIIKDLLFTEYGYYVENNIILNPNIIINALLSTITSWKNSNNIWAFAPFFNSSEVSHTYCEKLLNKLGADNAKLFCCYALIEVNNLKTNDLLCKHRRYGDEVISSMIKPDIFRTYRDFNNCAIWGDINNAISLLLNLIYCLRKHKWYETVEKIKNPILIHTINEYYTRAKSQVNFSVPEKIRRIPDRIIALVILNYIEKINKWDISRSTEQKYVKKIINEVNKLGYKKFFWYGLVLDTGYYVLSNPKKDRMNPYFTKQVKKELTNNLLKVKNKNMALLYLKKGLKSSSWDVTFRHLEIFRDIEKHDAKLADYLRKVIIHDYKKLLESERCHIPINQEEGRHYTNVTIYAISELTIKRKIHFAKLFDNILKKFYLTEEDYLYNSSEMIHNKNRIIQIFTVLFYCLEWIQKTKAKIPKSYIEKYFDTFLKFINLHMQYEDHELKLSIDVIFKLNIAIKSNILYKEINLLMDMPVPPFHSIAILISKVPESSKTKRQKNI